VPFDRRAWHAGRSEYCGRSACNDFSVGIELISPLRTRPQSRARAHVALRCSTRRRGCRVVGHSDIALGRKTDQGRRSIGLSERQLAIATATELRCHNVSCPILSRDSAPSRIANRQPVQVAQQFRIQAASFTPKRYARCGGKSCVPDGRRPARVPPGGTNSWRWQTALSASRSFRAGLRGVICWWPGSATRRRSRIARVGYAQAQRIAAGTSGSAATSRARYSSRRRCRTPDPQICFATRFVGGPVVLVARTCIDFAEPMPHDRSVRCAPVVARSAYGVTAIGVAANRSPAPWPVR
jgi:hypothetical protein